MEPLVLCEWTERVAVVTLNRPQRHNALVPELVEALLDTLAEIAASAGVRAVVLQAAGRSFSTGGDLQGFLDHWAEVGDYAHRLVGTLNAVILALMRLPVPLVAAAQGWTTGGSLGLLLAADVVLLGEDARIAPYYTDVGFSPDGGWTALLPAVVGAGRALEIQLSNRILSAEEACWIGLASHRAPVAELPARALELAEGLAKKVPASVRATKALTAMDPQRLADALDAERRWFIDTVTRADTRAAVEDFLRRAHTG